MKKVLLTLALVVAMPVALVNCASSGRSDSPGTRSGDSRGSDSGMGGMSGGGTSTSPSGSSGGANPYPR